MPIYEYTCQKCKAHTEILQKLGDKPLTRCKKCGGKLEKQWSASGIQFKGAGWYVNDYAKKKPDVKETQGESKGEGKSEGKSEAKTEAKAETKAETKAGGDEQKKTPAAKAPSGD